jgi:hypothetical protein
MANFNVGKDAKTVNVHLKLSLRAGVKNKSLKQSKGTGASGSFKIGEVVKPKKKPPLKGLLVANAYKVNSTVYFFFGVFLGLTALVFFGDLVAFFAGLIEINQISKKYTC